MSARIPLPARDPSHRSLSQRVLENAKETDIATQVIDLARPHYMSDDTRDKFAVSPYPFMVTYTGTDQGRFPNPGCHSACGLCASHFLRCVFKRYQSNKSDMESLFRLLLRDSFLEITNIAQYYQRTVHLESPDIVGSPSYTIHDANQKFRIPSIPGLPYFTSSLTALRPIDSLPRTRHSFTRILQTIHSAPHPLCGAIITCPPEILSTTKVPLAGSTTGSIYIVYDSHRRMPRHGNGAAMTVCPTLEDAAIYLTNRFIEHAAPHISASFVVPRDHPPAAASAAQEQLLLDASMRMLSLRIDAARAPAPARPQQQPRGGAGTGKDDYEQVLQDSLRTENQRLERVIAGLNKAPRPQPRGGKDELQQVLEDSLRTENQRLERVIAGLNKAPRPQPRGGKDELQQVLEDSLRTENQRLERVIAALNKELVGVRRTAKATIESERRALQEQLQQQQQQRTCGPQCDEARRAYDAARRATEQARAAYDAARAVFVSQAQQMVVTNLAVTDKFDKQDVIISHMREELLGLRGGVVATAAAVC